MPSNPIIPGLVVQQWLESWDEVEWEPEERRRKPERQFYLFSVPAATLRSLCQVYRRSTKKGPRIADEGVQRYYEKKRADEIARFVKHGYPWSQLTEAQQESGEFDDLRKPGWLPTAIIVNVLPPGASRGGQTLDERDAVEIVETGAAPGTVELRLPSSFRDRAWSPSLPPMEIIDGQHRLWAFGETVEAVDFQMPVVAFRNLDISWQAYLFWSINITPTRINPSLAFDLIPLLRKEEWLERFAGPAIYRQARAQELVEALWSHPQSAWFHRINMLGEPIGTARADPQVSQAAWIRALTATLIKPWNRRAKSPGGLFGAPTGKHQMVLPWSRTQQAAVVMWLWNCLRDSVRIADTPWAVDLRELTESASASSTERDAAFAGRYSILATDQGVRGVLATANDLSFVAADELDLVTWMPATDLSTTAHEAVLQELNSLKATKFGRFLRELAKALSTFDWRSAATPGLSDDERRHKGSFRGSGGYALLTSELRRHVAAGSGRTSSAAMRIVDDKLGS